MTTEELLSLFQQALASKSSLPIYLSYDAKQVYKKEESYWILSLAECNQTEHFFTADHRYAEGTFTLRMTIVQPLDQNANQMKNHVYTESIPAVMGTEVFCDGFRCSEPKFDRVLGKNTLQIDFIIYCLYRQPKGEIVI